MSKEIRRAAQAMRAHSARVAAAHGPKSPQLAIVRQVVPLTAEMTDHRLQLDDDDLILAQAVRRYHTDYGIVAGDTLVLIPTSGDDFVVVGVLSENEVKAGIATPKQAAGGRVFATITEDVDGFVTNVALTPITGVIPHYDANGNIDGYIPLIA